jgi:hypothetical protein
LTGSKAFSIYPNPACDYIRINANAQSLNPHCRPNTLFLLKYH